MWIRISLAALLALVLAAPAHAERVSPADAMATLVGKIWRGVDRDGAEFWFWHDDGPQNGTFIGMVGDQPEYVAEGTWRIEGDEVCWEWPNEVQCYDQFGRDGRRVWRMRADGAIESGGLFETRMKGAR